jgi:glutathione peroxidase
MKAFVIIFSILTFTAMSQSSSIYDYSFKSIDGENISLKQFKGKKILFVNVASKCGFTGQYEQLQDLHEQFGEKVTLIGFPCDQFGRQEPGSESEIKAFCQKNYGVEFLMASKIDVKGGGQHPIYKWLTHSELNKVGDSKVAWNFTKYLVGENGTFISQYSSRVNPLSEEITNQLK